MSHRLYDESVDFRFLDFDEELLPDLASTLPGVELVTGSHHETRRPVVCFQLDEGRNYDRLCGFVEKTEYEQSAFGLWVAITSNVSRGKTHVPGFALDLVRRIGGQIDFSFIGRLEHRCEGAGVRDSDGTDADLGAVASDESSGDLAEDEIYREELIQMRITDLKEELLPALTASLGGIPFMSCVQVAPGLATVTFEWPESADPEQLCLFLQEYGVQRSSYSFRMTVETDRGDGGICTPQYVIDLFRRIGGHMTFAFRIVD